MLLLLSKPPSGGQHSTEKCSAKLFISIGSATYMTTVFNNSKRDETTQKRANDDFEIYRFKSTIWTKILGYTFPNPVEVGGVNIKVDKMLPC